MPPLKKVRKPLRLIYKVGIYSISEHFHSSVCHRDGISLPQVKRVKLSFDIEEHESGDAR